MNLTFTGERPIPGATPDVIFNGVMARYIHAKRLLDGIPVDKILDVGCGTGIGSGFIASRGISVTGIDVDSESLKWGINNKLYENLTLIEGPGENLPFDNETFDCVIAFECIEHMLSPYAFILEANRVLKSGGILICSVPYCIGDVLAEILNGDSNPYHIQRYTPQTMRHLLATNFVIEEEWGQRFHSIDHYTYVLVNDFIWRSLMAIPLLGNLFLNWRNKRNTRLSHLNSKIETGRHMNYEFWLEDNIPLEWALERMESGTKRIPETMIFLSRKQ